MREKVKLKISPAVAKFVGPKVQAEEKLRGIETSDSLVPADRITLIFCLMRDTDKTVAAAASIAFKALPEDCLLPFLRTPDPHYLILDAIARFHYSSPAVCAALLECSSLSASVAEFLKKVSAERQTPQRNVVTENRDEEAEGSEEEAEEEFSSEEMEGLTKQQMVQFMGPGEKVKMALTGDKEWRAILINDNNKQVSANVIKNPRMTEGEIVQLLKVGVQHDEIIRLICANKEWVKNYAVRKALVDSPKTPVSLALRFLTTLNARDIAICAKNRNVSSVISSQAKRMLAEKK